MNKEEIKKTLKENDIKFEDTASKKELNKIMVDYNLMLEKNKEESLLDEIMNETDKPEDNNENINENEPEDKEDKLQEYYKDKKIINSDTTKKESTSTPDDLLIKKKEDKKDDIITEKINTIRDIAEEVHNKFEKSKNTAENNQKSKIGNILYKSIEKGGAIEIYEHKSGKLVRIYKKSDFKGDDYKKHAKKYIESRKYLLK